MRNLQKRSNSKVSDEGDVPASKKGKGRTFCQTLLKRCPLQLHEDTIEDEESVQQHISSMTAEMSKKRPRDHVVLPLLKSTYSTRRDFIISDDRSDNQEILNLFPAAVIVLMHDLALNKKKRMFSK